MTEPRMGTAPAIVERAGEATLVVLATGIITWLNEAAQHLYGYGSAELLGRPVTDLAPFESHDGLRRVLQRVSSGEQIDDLLMVRRHRDGTEFPIAVTLHTIPHGDVGGLLADSRRHHSASDAAPEHLTPAVPNVDQLESLLGRIPGVVFDLDTEGRITWARGAGLATLGVTPDQVILVPLEALATDEVSRSAVRHVVAGGSYSGPVTLDGAVWEIIGNPIFDDGGTVTGVACSVFPVQQAWEGTTAQALTEARFRALVQHSSDLVAVIDAELRISYVSPSVEVLLGWRPEEVVGRKMTDFVRGEDLARIAGYFDNPMSETPKLHLPGPPGDSVTLDLRLRHKRGGWRHYELVNSDYLDDPAVQGVVLNGRDVTERRHADLRLRHASLHDPLTDLPNRTLLIERVEDGLAQVDRAGSPLLGVVAIGLDRFKLVNDSLGHDIGDHLLVAVSRRLRHQVRGGDTVARMGGDTFMVISTGIGDAEGAVQLAHRLLAALAEPFDLDGRRIVVTACAGVAVSSPAADATMLIRDADSAMYAAKQIGRNQIQSFSPSLRSNATRLLSLEQSLRRATSTDQLRVHFQPIMDLKDETVSGVEALVRWEHPDLGLVAPNDFIPLAEETGHIVDIGAWVLRESCRTVMSWADGRPIHLSVNLSPRQLLERDLADRVATILDETGFPVRKLTMEVTESVLVDDVPFVNQTLQQLRELGMQLSIDDFGTGYSSLVYLRRLHAGALKIDRSFVDGLGRDSDSDAIVRAVVSLAHSMGLLVVAEGVETVDQQQILVELGCELAQGFLFSRPLPSDEFIRWCAGRLAVSN